MILRATRAKPTGAVVGVGGRYLAGGHGPRAPGERGMRGRVCLHAPGVADSSADLAAILGRGVMLALEFSDTFDLTAVGTLALALVTVALALATFRMVRLTRQSLKQTQGEIDLSRAEVEEAHRPVVVPVADDRIIDYGPAWGRNPAKPEVMGNGAVLLVPVENVGAGPALGVEASARLLDAYGKPSGASSGPQTPAVTTGLGTDRLTTLVIEVHNWGTDLSFELTVLYQDVAGRSWRTVGRWSKHRARYEALTIERAPNR